MYKRVIIFPYKMSSDSSKVLAQAIREEGVKVIRVYKNRNYQYKEGDLVINWGNSEYPTWRIPIDCINRPEYVSIACDKIDTLKLLYDSEVRIPQFETRKDLALRRLHDQDWDVCYCRTLLNSHSGKGIVVAHTPDEIVDAPLYTQGIVTKRIEYRVHIFNGEVIDYAQKKKKNAERLTEIGLETADPEIRSFDNGWVFCRTDVRLPEIVKAQTVLAAKTLNLHFTAVDICFWEIVGTHGKTQHTVVFELNTAPGLEGVTIQNYKKAILNLFNT